MSKIVFLDTETTGMTRGGEVFKGHRLVEIALLTPTVSDRYEEYQLYFNPMQPVSPEALAVHGLTDSFLKGFPKFSQCAEKIVNEIRGVTLIAHNAPFDIAFLDYELNLAGLGPVSSYCEEVIDTLVLARKKFPGQKNSLDALCQRFGISLANRAFHGGLKDCYLLSQVYRCLRQGQRLFDFTSLLSAEPGAKAGSADLVWDLPICAVTTEEIQCHEQFFTQHLS